MYCHALLLAIKTIRIKLDGLGRRLAVLLAGNTSRAIKQLRTGIKEAAQPVRCVHRLLPQASRRMPFVKFTKPMCACILSYASTLWHAVMALSSANIYRVHKDMLVEPHIAAKCNRYQWRFPDSHHVCNSATQSDFS